MDEAKSVKQLQDFEIKKKSSNMDVVKQKMYFLAYNFTRLSLAFNLAQHTFGNPQIGSQVFRRHSL
jgi:hypothetical protein